LQRDDPVLLVFTPDTAVGRSQAPT